jgi:hypothetical protein
MAGKPAAKPPLLLPKWWVEVAKMRKTLLGWPAWSDPEPLTPAKAVKPDRPKSDLLSNVAETTEVVIPLGNADGVGLQGVQLRMNAWAYRRNHEVTATLEVGGGRSAVTIARVAAWPADTHFNTLARKHGNLGHVPPEVDGSHVHRFRDNARIGAKVFRPPFNLPVAIPVTEPLTGFRAFLRTVATEFVIIGLEEFDPPPWQEYLL